MKKTVSIKDFKELKESHNKMQTIAGNRGLAINQLQQGVATMKEALEIAEHRNVSLAKTVHNFHDHNVKLLERMKSMNSVVYRYELFTALVISLTLFHVILVAVHV